MDDQKPAKSFTPMDHIKLKADFSSYVVKLVEAFGAEKTIKMLRSEANSLKS